MRGRLIVVEGMDCWDKRTQSELLCSNLEAMGRKTKLFSFPNYDSPTGKIVRQEILDLDSKQPSKFQKEIMDVDPKVRTLYFLADQRYHLNQLNEWLNDGYDVILDRYLISNMAYQGASYNNIEERQLFYEWVSVMGYEMLELPRPDLVLVLSLPYEVQNKLSLKRSTLDTFEKDEVLLRQVEKNYSELVAYFGYSLIECAEDMRMKELGIIQKDLLESVVSMIHKKSFEAAVINALSE